jgi:hypothetical protein
MAQVITATAMRARRIALAALMSAPLVGLAFVALSTNSALAAQNTDTTMSSSIALAPPQWHRIGFAFSPIVGVWTRDPAGVRTKTSSGNIDLSVTDNVPGGLCVRLRSAENGSPLGLTRCWPASSFGSKTLAADVLADTRFTVWATAMHPSTADSTWVGYIYY